MRQDFRNWHIASLRGDAEFGRYRGKTDIGQPAPIELDSARCGISVRQTDLPDGQFCKFRVQPSRKKYFACPVGQITSTSFGHSVPREGRWPSSRTLGRDAVDAAASGARLVSQGEMNLVSDFRRARRTALFSTFAKGGGPVRRSFSEGGSRTAKPCGPGTRCWCQVGGGFGKPDRARQDRQFADDGDKTNSSPGRARNKPLKPLRGECRVFRGTCGD